MLKCLPFEHFKGIKGYFVLKVYDFPGSKFLNYLLSVT